MDDTFQNAFLGSLVADAVAMPVHWYYDTAALDRDYGAFSDYVAPKNPHPDSILWRSEYTPINAKADILREQAQYWGQPGVHYHQFLKAGENTLNYRLAAELYMTIVGNGGYDPDVWLERYMQCMLEPGWHRDTYLEEYHRAFFTNLAKGRKPRSCGIKDIHIGALATVPTLIAGLDALGEPSEEDVLSAVDTHVALTHQGTPARNSARALVRILFAIDGGEPLAGAVCGQAADFISRAKLDKWLPQADRAVVGRVLTPACYLPESFSASLYLAVKYADDFSAGVCANAMVGGDNCHRGAVVGALLGAATGVPERWLANLAAMEDLRCDAIETLRR